MKIFKKILSAGVTLSLILSLCACGTAESPTIGENGNWFVGGQDTGVSANGIKGEQGKQGDDGESVEIEGFKLSSSADNVDTYTITFSNGTQEKIKIENGTTPVITGFDKVGTTNAGIATYLLKFADGTTASISFKDGVDGKDGASTIENFEIVYSATVGRNTVITGEAATLSSNQSLDLVENRVMNNKHFTASFTLDSLGSKGKIRIGHGETTYAGGFIEISKDSIINYSVGSGASLTAMGKTQKHGLDISGNIKVAIDVTFAKAKIQIMTETADIFVMEDITWAGGRSGSVFIKPIDVDLTDVKASWSCDDYKNSVWMIGDSYFNATDASRWTSYLVKNGYTNNLMISQSGMNTQTGLAEFKEALKYGTPKYAFWCVGMNNGDGTWVNGELTDSSTIESAWLSSTEEFLEICNEKGIIPILSTIPSTPTVLNKPKSDWVKASGYRYVDFESAVGADVYNANLIGEIYINAKGEEVKNQTGYDWYENTLYPDLVHPDKLGAELLYAQAIIDFPELMIK